MSEGSIKQDVVDAIDDIRGPRQDLLGISMAAVRANKGASTTPRFAASIAVLIAVAMIATLVAVGSLRRATAPHGSVQPNTAASGCELPVRTDQGPGLLAFPSGVFHPAGLPAAAATAYNPATHTWLPTEPEGVAADGQVVALLDNVKGHRQTLQLETSGGTVLFSRDNVMRILGWSSDGSLLVTVVDAPARILKISRDGTGTDWIDPMSISTTMWTFAYGQYVWGVAYPYPNPQQQLPVVRLDLTTKAVLDWYEMPPDSFNNSGGGPILGLSADGYPIVPQLKTDARSAVYVVRVQDVPTPLYVNNGDELIASNFWPFHVISGPTGTWVTTTDGELYRSSDTSGLQMVTLPGWLHVYAFGGSCT